MAFSRSGRLTIDTHSIFYTITSSASLTAGPILLFLHGWTCDSTDWSYQIPYLVKAFPSSRIVTLDFRHHGGSRPLNLPQTPASITHDTAVSTLVSDCTALLTHLNTTATENDNDKTIVIGHSLGGLVASELAYHRPNLIHGAVFVDPSYVVPHQAFSAFTEQLRTNFEPAIDGFFNNLYVPSTPELVKTWNRLRAWGRDRDVAIQGMRATVDGIVGGCGGESGGPVEYIKSRGRGDGGIKRLAICSGDKPYLEYEREVGLRADGVDQLEVLERGHWMAKSAPEEFNGILGRWLEGRMGLKEV